MEGVEGVERSGDMNAWVGKGESVDLAWIWRGVWEGRGGRGGKTVSR